jgi:hypothetical protein
VDATEAALLRLSEECSKRDLPAWQRAEALAELYRQLGCTKEQPPT